MVDGTSNGFPKASGPCNKCDRTRADLGKPTKLQATHNCTVCGHKRVKSPYVLYSPLASLKCSLSDTGTLSIGTLPSVTLLKAVVRGLEFVWKLPSSSHVAALNLLLIAPVRARMGVDVLLNVQE